MTTKTSVKYTRLTTRRMHYEAVHPILALVSDHISADPRTDAEIGGSCIPRLHHTTVAGVRELTRIPLSSTLVILMRALGIRNIQL